MKARNGCFKNLRVYFREYCIQTSVHGFQYIGEKKRNIFERIWWMFVFLICLAACIVSIYFVYKKWEGSPVIVNFANKGTPIYEIPFPAVTICPESKSDREKFNFTELMQRKEDGKPLNSTEDINFEYMSMICNCYPELNYTRNKTFSDDFFEIIDTVKPPLEIVSCSFLNKFLDNCSELFTPILTDAGVCYSFNVLNRSEIFRDSVLSFKNYHTNFNLEDDYDSYAWSLQDGYAKNAGLDPYPVRAHLAGASKGLMLNIVTPSKDVDYACTSSLQGYRVLLHTPMTIPRPSQNYFRIPLDQSVVGAIQPVMITTSQRVKSYDPEKRGCYFSFERHLKYFRNYTSSNCRLECLTNYTLSHCKCVNFYMPRENGTSICGTGQINCMSEAEEIMDVVALRIKLENLSVEKYDCNCLPVCSDLTYESDTSQTDWNWKENLRARRNLPRIDEIISHLSSLTLFFKSDNFISSERNELYGPIDFLANFGGLLGLFTGFSVLSLMEIIYFLTIRVVCNFRLFGQWAGEEA